MNNKDIKLNDNELESLARWSAYIDSLAPKNDAEDFSAINSKQAAMLSEFKNELDNFNKETSVKKLNNIISSLKSSPLFFDLPLSSYLLTAKNNKVNLTEVINCLNNSVSSSKNISVNDEQSLKKSNLIENLIVNMTDFLSSKDFPKYAPNRPEWHNFEITTGFLFNLLKLQKIKNTSDLSSIQIKNFLNIQDRAIKTAWARYVDYHSGTDIYSFNKVFQAITTLNSFKKSLLNDFLAAANDKAITPEDQNKFDVLFNLQDWLGTTPEFLDKKHLPAFFYELHSATPTIYGLDKKGTNTLLRYVNNAKPESVRALSLTLSLAIIDYNVVLPDTSFIDQEKYNKNNLTVNKKNYKDLTGFFLDFLNNFNNNDVDAKDDINQTNFNPNLLSIVSDGLHVSELLFLLKDSWFTDFIDDAKDSKQFDYIMSKSYHPVFITKFCTIMLSENQSSAKRLVDKFIQMLPNTGDPDNSPKSFFIDNLATLINSYVVRDENLLITAADKIIATRDRGTKEDAQIISLLSDICSSRFSSKTSSEISKKLMLADLTEDTNIKIGSKMPKPKKLI